MDQMEYMVDTSIEVNYEGTESVLGGIPNLLQLKQSQSTIYVDPI